MRQAWPLVEPAPLVWGWHLDAKCDHLEAVARGDILKLLINEPPGHGKSLVVSVLWPAWLWIERPEWRSLFGSYAAELAIRDSVRCRSVIESEWYQERYALPGGWGMRPDQNAKDYFVNTRTGHRLATSVGGGGTGHRGDLVAIDDPLNALDAYSKAARAEAVRWIGQTMSTRFNDATKARTVVIMQRLHEEDPAGWILAGGGWEHLCLPSEFDPARRSITYRTVTRSNGHTEQAREEFWRDPRTEPGELLFPAKFPAHVLAEAKRPNALGEEGYAGQHQQRPTPPGGLMFKIGDWRFWKPDGAAPDHSGTRPTGCYDGPANPAPAEFDRVIISVDGTFKKTERGSYVAIHVWGAIGARRLLLDRVHERMDYDTCERALVGDRSKGTEYEIGGIIGRWPDAREKVVEDKANGPMLVNRLTNVLQIPGVIAEPSGTDSKEQRASVYSLPYHRAGNVELPDGAPWIHEYIAEHASFPLGKANDDVDAQSQALRHLEKAPTVLDEWGKFKPEEW